MASRTVELDRSPSLSALYGRALLAGLPGRGAGGDSLPDTELVLRNVLVDRNRLADYARVCGFPLADTLPPTYPHVLGFPLALHLFTAPDFPFSPVGVVHVANRVEVRRPVAVVAPLDLRVRAQDPRPHERGRQFDVVTEASVGDEPVWRETATYLRRSSSASSGGRAERLEPPTATAVWRVEPGVARAYATASGDRNPIHLSTVAARAFGFRGRIAHGMWTKARCLAQLAGRLPEAYTVEVEFKSPLLLPSVVGFSSARPDGELRFAVHHPKSGKPHLTGVASG